MAINTQKFLPQGKGGGSLAVRPKTSLAPIKKQSSSLAKVGGKQEDPMLIIKTKVIKIEDLLKGTLAAEKKAADEKKQLKKDAKEMGYGSDTKGYIETKARYGSKENMKSGRGLGT